MFPFNANNRRLVEAALGNNPADMVVRNGTLADVYTGRMVPKRSVAMSGKRISYVGPDPGYAIGEKTLVIEADGRIISPGYIDAHAHVANFFDIADLLEYAVPGGTTTYITEAESYGFALGAEGFRVFLEQVRNRPVKFFCTVPPLVTISPASAPLFITADEIRELLKMEDVLGLGESYWQNAILPPDDRVLELFRETIKAGKSVEGHAAGAAGKRLAAYAAAGATSCHEAVSPEDIINRLEMGYWAIIREGYIRRDIESLRPLIGKIDLRRCILCTDGMDPEVLLNMGYFVDVIQKAVDIGLEPLEAIRMATLNPAERFRIDHLVGGLAPGRFADILILPEPGIMKPDLVISEGRIIAEKGRITVAVPRVPYPDKILKTVNAPFISPEQISVPVSACNSGRVRTMDIQANGLLAREGSAKISSANGNVLIDPDNDLFKVVYMERFSGRGVKFVGFIRGWGMKRGAAASSLAWDTPGIVAVGANDIDIAMAVNRVIELQGGTVLALDREIKIEIPFRIAGYVSDMSVEDIASGLSGFQKTAESLGSSLRSAHLTLVTLTTAAIPFMRITEKGYFRFRENDYVGI